MTIAAKYRLLFEFFGTIRTFHLRLPVYFLIAACYERNYEYCHRRAVTACTITHITAETVRYGGGIVLRFYTEDEEQRKWKTSIKVNCRHVSKTTLFGILGPVRKYVPISAYSRVPKPVSKSKSKNLVDTHRVLRHLSGASFKRLAARKLR